MGTQVERDAKGLIHRIVDRDTEVFILLKMTVYSRTEKKFLSNRIDWGLAKEN